MGGASRWWLHHSLAALDRDLRKHGSRLILRRGAAANVLATLASETGASGVHALHHYEPWWRNAETALSRHVGLTLHDGNYLMPPGSVTTGSGTLFKIYTPFWRALSAHMPPARPRSIPRDITAPAHWPDSDALDGWKLLPSRPDWARGFANDWTPVEAGARDRLSHFQGDALAYDTARNLPSQEGTSRLSPHLHFGELSPTQVWHAVPPNAETFLKEIAWRDYAQTIVVQFPDYARRNGRDALDMLEWRDADNGDGRRDLTAWQRGRTGYPIVDAGMRQLWATGWMHNRVRMIAASFLIKHLLIDWRIGERWFWDTLVDADYGSNSVNWQWVAGTGVDANMFVRIMAPLVQSEKFDAADYIRHWIPELADLSDADIHDPHAAGVAPNGYPSPLIGHREARERALAAYRKLG